MKKFLKILKKTAKISGISLAIILLLLYLLPILFPGTIKEQIINWSNQNLAAKVDFSKVRLSFFTHFPSLTLSLYDFKMNGSAPYKNDTLVAAKEIAFGLNLKSLFGGTVHIDKIFVDNAYIKIRINEQGFANYNVYVSSDTAKSIEDSSTTQMKIKKISITNSHFVYDDKSTAVLLNAKGFNYTGKGDLSKAIFDLQSRVEIDSMDFFYENFPYLLNKAMDGDLITKINTNSLSFIFEKNDLYINRLPVVFNGKFDFLKDGYYMDFNVTSKKSKLYDFFTALPPQYLTWLNKTDIGGTTDIEVKLKGYYIFSTNTFPTLDFNMQVQKGKIAYENAPYPIKNLYYSMQSKLPSLNADSLYLKIDSLHFELDNNFLNARLQMQGLTNPDLNLYLNTELDLEKIDKALGIEELDLKGLYKASLEAKGKYLSLVDTNSIRSRTYLASIPTFNFQSECSNGYIKYKDLPQALSNISFKLNSYCKDHQYKNIFIQLQNLNATALNNSFKGNLSLSNLANPFIDVQLNSNIQLSELKSVFPMKGFDYGGLLSVAISSKGNYDKAKKQFPQTTASIILKDGKIKTPYYPNAISSIRANATITNTDGTLKTTQFKIQPAGFVFEDKPFEIQASFENFDDLLYDVTAKGEINLTKIYKVFSQKGIDVSGNIKANLNFKGKQSDATKGNYSKLRNSGTLEVDNINIFTEYLPQPFLIKYGSFRFAQDKMWFNQFAASYRHSDFLMNGYFENVINFALLPNEILKGNVHFHSKNIFVDEFTAYAPATDTNSNKIQTLNNGVIVLPSNFNITFSANADKVNYNGIELKNAKSTLQINKGKLQLKETAFEIIGCKAEMDASYESITARKAGFDFHIKAKDFDIQKAYKEIKLFRDMATSAAKTQGLVSIDYNIKGILDNNLMPVYPSLQGGGILSLGKVKVKGLKLFGAVSKKTDKDIKEPDMKNINIKTAIKNNVITIEKFKIKTMGFRIKIEGKTNFDGQLLIRMRLGLPPFGIFGIPMRITGTHDNPIVKLGKGSNEEVKETEYEGEETKNN